jgi:hypothetical protein
MAKRQMTELELRAAIDAEVKASLGNESDDLSNQREKALELYLGKPLGNEVAGRSQIVSYDAMETVEWALPAMLRIFAQKDVVAFLPLSEDDEAQALQEALYLNQVFMQDNPGFLILYTWFKDAFISKVGYVKAWWEELEEIEVVSYTGQTLEQITLLMQDHEQQYAECEIEEQESRTEKTDMGPIEVYDVKIRCVNKRGRINVENIPPEEVVVGRGTKAQLCKSDFVGHLRELTRSDLISMGFTKDQALKVSNYQWERGDSGEAQARDTVENTHAQDDDVARDPMSETVKLLECYIRIDFDRDDYAELRKCLVDGEGIVYNEEFDHIPIYAITPIPMPHRHVGLSLIDTIADLAVYKTQLMRQVLDNAYLSNNKRLFVDRNVVNIADMMTNRPGSITRVNGNPSGAVWALEPTPIIRNVGPIIDYLDTVKENRVGIGRMTNGLDADVLQNATKGAIDVASTAAASRIEAIARIFAETGVKDLFLGIHKLLRQHQDWSRQFQLRGTWVPISPSKWRVRNDLVINAGLGNNTRDEVKQSLATMAQAQEKAAAAGIVLPKNVYNLAVRFQRELGFESSAFFSDPESDEFKEHQKSQQPPEDPLLAAQKMKSEIDMQKLQWQQQMDQQEAQIRAGELQLRAAELALKKQELERRFGLDLADVELKYATDLAKVGIGAELRGNPASGGANQGGGRQAAPGQPAPQ